MIQFASPRFQRAASGLVAVAALAAGLLATNVAFASQAFDNRMAALVDHIKSDPGYKRIPLATAADKEWFYDQTEHLFENKLSKDDYVSQGAQRYPGYEASFSSVADFITSK